MHSIGKCPLWQNTKNFRIVTKIIANEPICCYIRSTFKTILMGENFVETFCCSNSYTYHDAHCSTRIN